MTQFGRGLPPTTSTPLVLHIGNEDTGTIIATLQTPEGASPPTPNEIGRALREAAALWETARDGVMIPMIVSYLDRP